jgi:hypothetical protein
MISTIQLVVYPSGWSEHIVWASILLFLLTRGPGAVSLDHLIDQASYGPAAPRSALDQHDPNLEWKNALVACVVRHESREPADRARPQHLPAGGSEQRQLPLEHDAQLRVQTDVLARRGTGREHEQGHANAVIVHEDLLLDGTSRRLTADSARRERKHCHDGRRRDTPCVRAAPTTKPTP